MNIGDIKFDEKGLVPVVVQDAENGQVLMFAYANKEAIEKTLETRRAHFWSRSRNKLWRKGEESGNFQEVNDIFLDCDGDTVLLLVNQKGVACHTGKRSCFFTRLNGDEKDAPSFGKAGTKKTLEDVYQIIDDRKRNPRDGSYVSGLFDKGLDAILKKVGEEAGETIIAVKNRNKDEVVYEATDLWFHTLVALAYFGITPDDIYQELGRRFGKKKEAYGQNKSD
ncbi:MAG TPA: bifunctional phosphoribosyl-AMP cyclohydrolase/phosphoribosyl-ATP diphosphatase HisIE [Thermodesulfobacteriota bacterium]|nr:bifunctional phosphoribosyl-AMP cyclohydrolase/phosphoribosyl-ATP diphosphatase HisIE [Thermodesulfobacteriota bacterium]